MSQRTNKENYYLDIADAVLQRSTCLRRKYGAIIVLNDEINAASRQSGPSGGMVFLYSLITCGIYSLYWMYKMGERVEIIQGTYSGNTGLLYLVMSFFGLGCVAMALMQDALNRLYP